MTDKQLRAAVLRHLTLTPCHVTGMHDPTHTDRYLCNIQKAELLDALLAAAGLTPGDLPRAVHENCRHCSYVPREEYDRAEHRKLYEWAGQPVPADLAAPDWGCPQPGDYETVLAVLADPPKRVTRRDGEDWHTSHEVAEEAARRAHGTTPPPGDERTARMFTALRLLADQGAVERHPRGGGYFRLPVKEPANG